MSRPFVELYIDNEKVEFKEPPQINITYSHSDLHNPTVVKNSFSKTITIDGTPHNNQIFGCFYDMTRIVANGDSMVGGFFNPSKKVPFTLYRNGEPMESGYVKLDKVKKNGNNIQYDITLFGGLGQFLYNLQYKEDGEKMKLSDLEYNTEFNFEVNKETVSQAWYRITGIGGKWSGDTYAIYDHINFVPCYNGIPENFTADKVAIDVLSFKGNNPRLYEQFTTSKDGYGLIDGKWLIAELDREYDEWQMKDLRSYLQRPVIRFKDIIQSCCKPENNGGYTVDLDPEFFNEQNQYYENAWMTLPLLSEMEVENKDKNEYANIVTDGDKLRIVDIEDGSTVTITIPFAMTATANADGAFYLYTGVRMVESGRITALYNNCRYVQLVVYDADGNVVNGSNINSFYTDITISGDFTYNPEYNTTINKIKGSYVNSPSTNLYVFNASLYNLVIPKIEWKDGYYMKVITKSAEYRGPNDGGDRTNINYLFKSNTTLSKNNFVTSVTWNATIDAQLYNLEFPKLTQKIINKQKLLNSENTPCDYFLSYLKMFNLHIWKDMYRDTIYVRLRKNYFIDEQYDLEEFVDRGDDITISPITFENKWLNFVAEYEQDEKLHKDYKDNYGLEYGIQKVDTNYSFDSSSKDVLENYVFKGCVTSRNRSKYYTNIYQAFDDDDVFYPPYCLDGFQTLLFKNGDTTEGSYITPKTTAKSINLWEKKYYDFMPKPNFTDKDNKSVEGANVLLFFNGRASTDDIEGNRTYLQITDDIPQFEQLNDSEPCWIWSMDWDISINYIDYLPNFSRYITNENNWITHSWDFGTPKALYVPDYNIDENSSIYTQYWKPYIRDMYDVNTRVVECKVLLKERVIGDWLRRFYYFDGSYWILNKITDYDVTSNGTTKCEFVRVNDITNYLT